MYPLIKRCLDWSFAWILLIASFPVMLTCAIILKIKSPQSGFLFRQTRIGKNGKHFKIYKFRTMTSEKDADGTLLPDKDRLFAFGEFMRKTSLDELPQCINILRGEMSFIGPRPLTLMYEDYFTAEEWRRHEVLPGISGLSQVNGRNLLDLGARFAKDVEYVDHLSFAMDFKIFFKTLFCVFAGTDVAVCTTETNVKSIYELRAAQKQKVVPIPQTQPADDSFAQEQIG